MFGFLMSEAAKARRDARNWLELADKVFHYRRDVLSDADLGELNLRRQELRERVKAKADAAQTKLAITGLEAVLRRVGGSVYPKTALADNVEFFLAAAIVILGIRAFFVQPFKIPTNSMWPTYFGMKHEVFHGPDETPGALASAARFLTLGATRRTVDAPVDGELVIPLMNNSANVRLEPFRVPVRGRKWLVVPTELAEYTFLVGGRPVRFRVPSDFDAGTMVTEEFAGGSVDVRSQWRKWRDSGRLVEVSFNATLNGETRAVRTLGFRTGRMVRAGEVAFSFDVLTGDQLFVDRISYHFFRPRVGEGFVFHTRKIPGIGQDQYYIKRLVGTPGDVLEIKEPVLLRNGAPITGAAAFEKNAHREGLYRGYFNGLETNNTALAAGQPVTVPPHSFFALGDNSGNSRDGRYWGFVPDTEAVGRPLFIYYPFTRRWGPAR